MRLTRKKLAIAVLVCAAVIALIVTLSPDNEPSYQGKKLSQWIESDHGRTGAFTRPELQEINRPEIQAVRTIGTNALPFLLNWIRYEPSPSKAKRVLAQILERFGLEIWSDPGAVRANRAAAGFAMLGPVASPAIPELAKLASASSGSETPRVATYALVAIGPTALPALVEVIKNTNAVARYDAVSDLNYALRKFGADAYPILIECLDDADPKVALEAADALAEAGVEPAIVCVKITRHFHHPDWLQRLRALQIVGRYRGQAREPTRTIVPDLVARLADTNSIVRKQAESLLRRVAPEVLTNVPAP
ncbi:MAG: hypothetical protein EPO07_11535 [Verrucomicrobia bacterium]|nr:MAG: hypothetical protein EPO07_11535 [Verrucomicrobiota bacterium]